MPVIDAERLIDNRVRAIAGFHRACGAARAELDLSGGVDSAVMAALLVGALAVGRFDEVFALAVAEVTRSLAAAGYDAGEIARRAAADPTVLGSIRSTLRAPLGRAYNRLTGGGIRHGTGNECEDRFLRYYQKGGDGEVDTNPLALLSKTEVYQLAFALGRRLGPAVAAALRPVILVEPSADLWGCGEARHTDEAELRCRLGAPFTYGRIDPDTGAVAAVGTIERVSRFADGAEALLFGAEEPGAAALLGAARRSGSFAGFGAAETLELLLAARRAERSTRHKRTLAPALGTRRELVEQGILTNRLPGKEAGP